ncbi:MAG: nucleotidyltransferase domain-containing protein [Streptosporangiaceae bacterium]
MDDAAFLDYVADHLYGLPDVQAVTLGGSRAQGTNRPDSDWDFAIYYRGHFDPQVLRDLGWPGQVFELGAWSPGVFNGGAWLEVHGRRSDVHYRDLGTIDHELAESNAGRFRIEPLLFHLAGIPTYLILAELAISQVLRGEVPQPDYPAALRARAPEVWWGMAERTFYYAGTNYAPFGRFTQCAGLVAQATTHAAHAVLAARGEWVTNEKTLLTRAGLREIDKFIETAASDPESLRALVERASHHCAAALREAKAKP